MEMVGKARIVDRGFRGVFENDLHLSGSIWMKTAPYFLACAMGG